MTLASISAVLLSYLGRNSHLVLAQLTDDVFPGKVGYPIRLGVHILSIHEIAAPILAQTLKGGR